MIISSSNSIRLAENENVQKRWKQTLKEWKYYTVVDSIVQFEFSAVNCCQFIHFNGWMKSINLTNTRLTGKARLVMHVSTNIFGYRQFYGNFSSFTVHFIESMSSLTNLHTFVLNLMCFTESVERTVQSALRMVETNKFNACTEFERKREKNWIWPNTEKKRKRVCVLNLFN